MIKIIGFDAKRIVRNTSGLGNYGRTLVNALAVVEPETQLYLYAPDAGREELRSQIEGHDNIQMRYPHGYRPSFMRALWRAGDIVKDLRNDKVSLYHGLTGELPKGIHKAGIPAIVTIHDLIFLRHPEYYKPIDVSLYKWKFHRTLQEADRIIAISECTKRDILYYSDYPEERIDVIYQSCDQLFKAPVTEDEIAAVKEKYTLPDRFILNVGTIEERKNVLLALQAMPLLPEELHLVIVGRRTQYTDQVMMFASKHHLNHRVHVLSGVPTPELVAIYHAAECFVYPSRYEGFGIPIIEAIQSGLPVVAATGSCLEEAGGPDSLYVNPDDRKSMADAILTAISERTVRVPKSQQYIRRFENNDVARQVIAAYHRLF